MSSLDPTASAQSLPETPAILVQSSSIIGYSYDPSAYTLDVFYKGKNLSVYRYFLAYPNVVSQIFDQGGSIGLNALKVLSGLRSMKLK